MSLLRVLRTAKATLSRTFYLDEVATDATGTVAVSITRLDGTAVESGNATGPAANVYSYVFGGRDVLDELVLTWSATVSGDAIVLDQDRIQVAGGFYWSLSEGRASDPSLADTTKFPSAKIIAARVEVEDECESDAICGQAFVPRFARSTVDGTDGPAIVLPHPWLRAVRSVTVSGVALTAPELAALGLSDTGVLRRDGGTLGGSGVWPLGRRNIVVEYEHGRDYPPANIVRVSKIRLKSILMQPRSPVPDRGQGEQVVSFPIHQPSVGGTGLPEVDAEYARYPSPVPGFGG